MRVRSMGIGLDGRRKMETSVVNTWSLFRRLAQPSHRSRRCLPAITQTERKHDRRSSKWGLCGRRKGHLPCPSSQVYHLRLFFHHHIRTYRNINTLCHKNARKDTKTHRILLTSFPTLAAYAPCSFVNFVLRLILKNTSSPVDETTYPSSTPVQSKQIPQIRVRFPKERAATSGSKSKNNTKNHGKNMREKTRQKFISNLFINTQNKTRKPPTRVSHKEGVGPWHTP